MAAPSHWRNDGRDYHADSASASRLLSQALPTAQDRRETARSCTGRTGGDEGIRTLGLCLDRAACWAATPHPQTARSLPCRQRQRQAKGAGRAWCRLTTLVLRHGALDGGDGPIHALVMDPIVEHQTDPAGPDGMNQNGLP